MFSLNWLIQVELLKVLRPKSI